MTALNDVYVFDDFVKLSTLLNSTLLDIATQSIKRKGNFTLAISGGSLPSILSQTLNVKQDTDKWHIFLADERCVPLDSPDSNYRLVKEHVLSKIPQAHVYPIRFMEDPHKSAKDYISQLKSVFKGGKIEFDLILLGMGPDGKMHF